MTLGDHFVGMSAAGVTIRLADLWSSTFLMSHENSRRFAAAKLSDEMSNATLHKIPSFS